MALETVKEGNVVTALADTVALPRMVKVRQKLDHTNVPREEILEKVRQELLQCGMAQRIHKGNSIAITCGSRGVANIAKIINSNPQVVFISTFGPTQPLIAKQLRQFGYNGLCFTKDLYQVDALNVAGAASNGIAFVYPYLTYSSVDECDDAFIKDFLTAYEAEYGTLPVSDCAYRAYDSMLVLKAACEAAGSNDGEAVAKAVGTLSGVQTLAGLQDFTTGDGEGLHEFNIFVIDGEKYMTWNNWEGTDGYNTVMEASGLN